MDIAVLSAFLYYGYVPDSSIKDLDSWLPYSAEKILELKRNWQSSTFEELVEYGSHLLQQIISAKSSKKNIVPLSGGLDSRAILGLLLQNYSSRDIKTITCGVPGTWDFDIGIQIAEEYNLESKKINLQSVVWDTKDLVNFSCIFDKPLAVTDAFLYSKIFENTKQDDSIYWIGFMGDPLVGSHLSNKVHKDWQAASSYFTTKECYSKNYLLAQTGFDPIDFLCKEPILDSNVLSFEEQLDFIIRQGQFIKPQVLLGSYNYMTPFLEEDWVNFTLSLPRKYRINQHAYKEILKYTFPELFDLPTKNNIGLPLGVSKSRKIFAIAKNRANKFLHEKGFFKDYINPNLNYVDFEKEFRSGSLKHVAQENLKDLKKRNIIPWINIEEIWREHQSRKQDLSKELNLLLSLEINIKAGHFK